MSKRYQIDWAALNRSGEVDLASATKIDCAARNRSVDVG